MEQAAEHTLEFLLAFDGRVHWYPAGYFAKFEIRRVRPTAERPHGLRYAFILHAPDGKRLIGFDNAHGVPAAGSRFNRRQAAADHWHRSGDDPGRPYPFKDAAGLIEDFLDEVRRVLESRGIPVEVVETGEAGGTDD
jgi:hypothetical protein